MSISERSRLDQLVDGDTEESNEEPAAQAEAQAAPQPTAQAGGGDDESNLDNVSDDEEESFDAVPAAQPAAQPAARMEFVSSPLKKSSVVAGRPVTAPAKRPEAPTQAAILRFPLLL